MNCKSPKLLTRNQFREGVLNRDGHRCVFCKRSVNDGVLLDAHHIMERRLWLEPQEFGGYYLENGATCCDTNFDKTEVPQPDGSTKLDYSCHLRCGMTLISPEECRKAAGVDHVWLPNHLYPDVSYTVWGDTILPNGRRLRGELFNDESVKDMLKLGNVLNLYDKYVRHFRTYHLPFSPKVISGEIGDDKVMFDLSRLNKEDCVITAKMDGGQTNWYEDYLHLRSLDFKSDPSTARMQALHDAVKYHLKGLRMNVENLIGSAVTDIQYHNLKSFYMPFMLWDNDKNICLSWNETVDFVGMLDDIVKNEIGEKMGMPLVKVLYRGPFSRDIVESVFTSMLDGDPLEGLVVRVAGSFAYKDSALCVGKYVREKHQVRHGEPFRPNYLKIE